MVQLETHHADMGPRRKLALHVIHCLLLILAAINVLMLLFYNTVTYRILLHSDAAVMNLMADEVFRTGQLFPKDWNYPNGDLWAFYGHLFILPFLPFFENGFALHALAGVATSALVISSLWLLIKELETTLTTRLFFLAFITTGISPFISEQIFGQLTYGTVLYLTSFQLYFLLRYLKRKEVSYFSPALSVFAIIIFLVFLSNPARALATHALPSTVGLIVLGWRYRLSRKANDPNMPAKVLAAASATFGAALIGSIGHTLVLFNTNHQLGSANARFLSYESIANNFSAFIRGWLNMVGGEPTEGLAVLSGAGIYETAHLVLALVLLVFPLHLFLKAPKKPAYLLLTAAFALVSIGIVSFFHVFTTVPDTSTASAVVQSSRYLVVTAVLLTVLLFSELDQQAVSGGLQLKHGFFLSLLLPLLAAGYFNFIQPALEIRSESGQKKFWLKKSQFDSVIARLKSENLEYGFASFWSANSITVLSSGRAKVRAIHPIAFPIPAPHLNSNDWYRANSYTGPTFFLLSNDEYRTVDWVNLQAYLGKPAREISEGNSRIVVYPFNIAGRLPGWDDQINVPLKLSLLPNSLHQVGRIFKTDDQVWLQSEPKESGYLAYGPYLRLAPGPYEAIFDISAEAGEGILAEVNVAVSGGRVIAKKEITRENGWQQIALPFEAVPTTGTYEFRVFSSGVSQVKSRAIVLRRASLK